MSKVLKSSLIASLIVGLFVAAPVWAQETGSMQGTVSDPDGAPLPGVVVTISGSMIPDNTVYTQSNGFYRFPALPPANDYSISFHLEGFATVVQEQVAVRVGLNTRVDVQLELSTVEETVTVTGTTPVVDTKSTTIGKNVTEEYMESIPSARDPWVMLEHTAGVQMDRQNVGGSESGQQSGFTAHGANSGDTVWTYDGGEITDVAALGASPIYYDFGAFEEISITTGGNDPSIATGGIRINFVTKRGGNQWRGNGRYYLTDSEFQSENLGDLSGELFPGFEGGNRINNIKDFGGDIGGPIVQDRFFVWGAYGKQDIKLLVGGGGADDTILTNMHAKGTFHATERTVLNFNFVHAKKEKFGRGASATKPPETTFDQGSPAPNTYTGKIQHTFSDNHYVEASYNNVGLGFFLEPRGGRDVNPTLNLDNGVWGNSYFFLDTIRPTWNFRADGNSYVAEALGGDHEIKYGYSHRNAEAESEWGLAGGAAGFQWPNDPFGLTGGDGAYQIRIQQDELLKAGLQRHSAYVGDTYTNGRWTLNLGLRYDHQANEELPSTTPASNLRPDIMPEIAFDGFDHDFAWSGVSPRFGLTYDLTGDASTVLKLTASRYYSQMGTFEGFSKATTLARVANVAWNDLDGDLQVDDGEAGELVSWNAGWNPNNPLAPSPNIVNATDPPWTHEAMLGIEHEVSRTLGVGVQLIYRKNGGFTWSPPTGVGPDDWVENAVTVPGADGQDYTVSFWDLAFERPDGVTYRQRPDFGNEYKGLELTLTKRLSGNWMGSMSYTYNDWKNQWESPAGYPSAGDPTNIAQQDGQQAAIGAGGSGITGILFGSSRHHFKASGMYQLPAGFNVAGFFQVRDGFVNSPQIEAGVRRNLLESGPILVLTEDFGETRLETFWQLDLRMEKAIDIGDLGRLKLMVDGFNIFNNSTALERDNVLTYETFGLIKRTHSPRVFRFGARLTLQ